MSKLLNDMNSVYDRVKGLEDENTKLKVGLRNLCDFSRHDFAMGKFVVNSQHWLTWKECEQALSKSEGI